jgi:hemerythrin-like metal-binding protein
MPLIPWEDKYSLGIKEIDEQHQKMLAIINKLYDLFENKKQEDQAEINRVIKEMADYALYHFATEENYFRLYGYEKAASHIQIHDQYRKKIEEWEKHYADHQDKAIFFEISDFLQKWWDWHINNTDREYVPFMKANGVK